MKSSNLKILVDKIKNNENLNSSDLDLIIECLEYASERVGD